MFQVSGGSTQAGPLTPSELESVESVEAFPAGEKKLVLGKNGSKNSKMSHFCMILNFFNLIFSQVEIWLHLPQFFWGLQFQKKTLETTTWMRGETKSAPWDDKHQSTSAISYNLSSIFRRRKRKHNFSRVQTIKNQLQKETTQQKNTKPTANNGDSFHFSPFRLPKKSETNPSDTGFVGVQKSPRCRRLKSCQRPKAIHTYHAKVVGTPGSGSHVWSYKFSRGLF